MAPEIEALAQEFHGASSIETIGRYLAESLHHFDDAKVHSVVPFRPAASLATGCVPSLNRQEPS